MTADERIASLEEQLKQAREEVCVLQEQVVATQKRIEELEKQKTPPAFAKANAKKPKAEVKKPRKKRDAQHNRGRPRAVPTQIVEHRLVSCPDCGLRLGGISQARVREIIDVPPPSAVEVTHHRIFKGWCAQCQKWYEAPVDVQAEVLEQGQLGVRLDSIITTLHSVMRLPIRQVRALLQTLHGVEVSVGEIVEVLHCLVAQAHPVLDGLKATLRVSPAMQADETGWREDGISGYIWSVGTPHICYYEYHHSRSLSAIKQMIGEKFSGVLGSDFSVGDNAHRGLHQRCWVHFLRDGHHLKEVFPANEKLHIWTKQAIYEQAVAYASTRPDPGVSPRHQHQTRVAHQRDFERQLWAICQLYVGTDASQCPMCERVERFLPELFVFVAIPEFLPTITSPSAVSTHWSSPAKSAGDRGVPKDQRLAWAWPVSLAPGWLAVSILFISAWLSLPLQTHEVKSEHLLKG